MTIESLLALIIGVIVSFVIISRFQYYQPNKKLTCYAILLATFPLYYFTFSVYAQNIEALRNEAILALPFFAIALVVLNNSVANRLYVLAFGFIAHGFYDIGHYYFSPHVVAPNWWPEFCGIVDLILAVYILKFYNQNKKKKLQ